MKAFFAFASIVTMLLASPAFAQKGEGKPDGGGDEPPSPAEVNPVIAFITNTSGRHDVVVAAADMASEIILTRNVQY